MQYLGSPEKSDPIAGRQTPIAIDEKVTSSINPSCFRNIVGYEILVISSCHDASLWNHPADLLREFSNPLNFVMAETYSLARLVIFSIS